MKGQNFYVAPDGNDENPGTENQPVATLRRKDDFSYSPRILAKKMGVTKMTVTRHLKKTGLIKQYKDDNGWWRIPQSVALKFCSAETLAIPLKHKKRSQKHRGFRRRFSGHNLRIWNVRENAPKARPPAQAGQKRFWANEHKGLLFLNILFLFWELTLVGNFARKATLAERKSLYSPPETSCFLFRLP